MSKTDTLENALRIHDQAVYSWLGGLHVDYGSISGTPFPSNEILRVFATPDNAYARMADILIRKGWIQRPTPEQQLTDAENYHIVPLPFLSIYREDPENDLTRANVPASWRGCVYNKDTGEYDNHPYPGTYTLTYQIDIWCLKKYTEAHIKEWFMSNLGRLGSAPNEMMLHVDHGEPWYMKLQGMKLESFIDNSELEGIEAERRYIRGTATFILNALVFRPADSASKPVMKVSVSSADMNLEDPKLGISAPVTETIYFSDLPFYDDGKTPESAFNGCVFDVDGDLVVKRAKLSSDGRIDPYTGKSSNGLYGCLEFNFGVLDSSATSEGMMLPPGRNCFAVRFAYLSPTQPFWFAVTDGNGVNIQKWILPRTSIWMQFECFMNVSGNLGLRWGRNAGVASKSYIDRFTIPWVPANATQILPTSDSVVGGSRVVRFDNLNKNRPHIISADLLNWSTDYHITIGDTDANPLLTTRILAVSGQWLNVAAVIQPSDTGSASIVLEDNPSITALAEAREYLGNLRGNFRPLS